MIECSRLEVKKRKDLFVIFKTLVSNFFMPIKRKKWDILFILYCRSVHGWLASLTLRGAATATVYGHSNISLQIIDLTWLPPEVPVAKNALLMYQI